jgi:tetratricopeptide (TPR) repeat protein
MVEARLPYPGLLVLGQAFRERSSGVLSIGHGRAALRLVVREGHIVAVVFPEDKPLAPVAAGPEDSAQLRLERVLTEIGIRPPGARSTPRSRRNLRERMLGGLLDTDGDTSFEAGSAPEGAVDVAGGTEALILEAIRRVPDPQAVHDGLGDLDRPVAPANEIAEERTLTLTEGYILSRADGKATLREVLRLVPLEPEETERALLGLLVTGRLETRPAATPSAAETPPDVGASPVTPVEAATTAVEAETGSAAPGIMPAETAEPPAETAEPPAAATGEEAPSTPTETLPHEAAAASSSGSPEKMPAEEAEVPAPSRVEIDHESLERRREVLELFQALPAKNHFEVLGVAPGCTDADVKRAYAVLARKYHPDLHRRLGLEDLHDVLEAIFIRIGEAWEVLGDARSRASYEARFPPGLRRRPTPGDGAASVPAGPPPAEEAAEPYVPTDETVTQAQLLLAQARYWDVIQMLEQSLPLMPPSKQQRRGRILLARAYAKNPNWLRKAEEALQQVVREEPGNADAHYELGLLYKSGGMQARAHASFRRAVELRPTHREAAAELESGPTAEARHEGGILKRLFGRGKAS